MQCYPNTSGCPGSYNNNCYPNIIWSGTLNSGSNYYYRNLNSGTLNESNYPNTGAFGVRCVLDLRYRYNYRQLCDLNSGYGALRCANYSGCPGSTKGCYPYALWSGTANGSKYYDFYLISGTLRSEYLTSSEAFGVRCVLGFEIRLEQVAELPYMFFDTVSISALEIFSECIKRVCLKPCLF